MRQTQVNYAATYEYCKLWTWPKQLGGRTHTGVGAFAQSRAKTSLESRSFKVFASEGRSVLPVVGHFLRKAFERAFSFKAFGGSGWTDIQRDKAKAAETLVDIIHELEAAGRGMCDCDRLGHLVTKHMALFVRLQLCNSLGTMAS